MQLTDEILDQLEAIKSVKAELDTATTGIGRSDALKRLITLYSVLYGTLVALTKKDAA